MRINNRGVAFLDTLVSTIIIIIVILMLNQFQLFLATNNQSLKKKILFYETKNNKITDIYNVEEWATLDEEEIETDFGNIVIKYLDYEPKTQYLTNKITVEFFFEGKTEQYVLERSLYFEK